MSNETLVRDIHPFTAAGMGAPPFRFLYVASIPSPSLGEQNPTAYSNALAALPRDLVNGCGTCGHCGTGIMNIHVIQNGEGKKFGVGCDCINKSDDMPLMKASRLEKLKADRIKRANAKVAKRAAYLAAVNPETGETNEQRIQRQAEEQRAAYLEQERINLENRRTLAAEMQVEADAMRDGKGGFADSVGMDMQAGLVPSGRAREIACEIIAKRLGGRTGSKAWEAAYEAITAKFERLASK